jgi:hypothetical protein
MRKKWQIESNSSGICDFDSNNFNTQQSQNPLQFNSKILEKIMPILG